MPITKCAVVDNDGNIQNVIIADATTDTLAGHTLIAIADDQELTGYIWNGTAFVPCPELAAQIAAEQAAIEQEALETE